MSVGKTPYFQPSIRMALIVALALALTPALIIIVWTGIEHGAHLTENAQMEAQRQVDSFAEIQTRITESAEQVLATLAVLPPIKQGDKERTVNILKSVHQSNPGHLNYSVVDTNGIVTASSRLATGSSLAQRDHIRRALSEKRFVAGEYFLNFLDAGPSIAYSYPFFDTAEKPAGVISLGIRLDSYGPLFDRLELPENSFLGLVDRNGVRLYFHPPKSTNPIGKPIKGSTWTKIHEGGERGTFTDFGSDGVSRFFAFKALRIAEQQTPYMYVVYGIPNASITAISKSILFRNLIIMAAVALFAVISAFLLSHRLFGARLASIIATTSRLRDGDLGARNLVKEDKSDLGQIAKALNLMAETIERRDAEKAQYAASLATSLCEKNILLKEVHHRVKNNLQLILSLIHLQSDASDDSQTFRENMENRIASMAVVHEMLYESDDMRAVDLGSYTARLIALVSNSMQSSVEVIVDTDSVYCELDTAISFGLLLNELAINAYKHAFKNGRPGTLRVALKQEGEMIRFEVSDDGPGLPPGFSISESSSLGLRLVQALTSQLNGTLSWGVQEKGACFTIVFPALARPAP